MGFNAERFVSDYRIQSWTSGKNVSPGWINITCPLCDDHSNHGGFNPGGYYHCWRCGGSSLWKVIKRLVPSGNPDDVIAEYDDSYVQKPRKTALAKTVEFGFEPVTVYEKRYMARRGLDTRIIVPKYNLRSGGVSGDWKYRIIIPIFDRKNRLVSYQGRDMTGKQEIRYKTLSVEKSVVNPKDTLFNIQNCKTDTVALLEGPFDVFKMGDGSLATLGTSMSEAQVRLLTLFERVVFCFDPEKEAQERALKYAYRVAAMGVDVSILDTGLDKDIGDCDDDEIAIIRKEIWG